MTTFLVATASVHTTAAACDYLESRAMADDTVVVASITGPDLSERDAGDAGNVARTRLLDPWVEIVTREGDTSEEIQALVADHAADEVLVGTRSGDPGVTAGLGGTTADLLVSLDVPVIVLPS